MKKTKNNINKEDFRHMHRGSQLAGLSENELSLLLPFNKDNHGKERALLLLHGFASSPAVYRYLIPQLKGYDRIYCPVLPGHASSIADFSQVNAEDWIAGATLALEELTKDYQNVEILGLSMGGLLACYLAQHYSLQHLYLLAPALKLRLSESSTRKLAGTLYRLGFRELRNAAGNVLSPQATEISYRRIPLSAILAILDLIERIQWKNPDCPVDLFLGEKDEVVDVEFVENLMNKEKNVKVHWLNQSAHVLPVDTDYQVIIDCINQFAKPA